MPVTPLNANVQNLHPNEKGERRGGRKAGVLNLQTRAMRTALMLAAEESEHSDGSLKSYLKFLADKRPELFAPMLARLIPLQAKIETTTNVRDALEKVQLNMSMPLDEMIRRFEEKIHDKNYFAPPRMPRMIEHEDDDRDDDERE